MAILQTRELKKYYGAGDTLVKALDGVELSVENGEFVAIIGTSGSGKSTMLHMLGGLDRPTSGTVTVDGRELSTLKDEELTIFRRRKIGFVFQSFNLISRTSALKNVELPMTYARVPKAKRAVRAQLLLERVGLGARKEHMPNELSGGQRQRVAIARALANEPPLILADEPTGNLDTASSVEIMELFTKLHQEGATVVLVTHEEDIAAFAHRVIRFSDGQIQSDKLNAAGVTSEDGKGGRAEC